MSALPSINNLDFSSLPGQPQHRRGVRPDSESKGQEAQPEKGRKATGTRAATPTSAKLDAAAAAISKRAEAAIARQKEALDQTILQTRFEFWDDASRGVPNPFIRSGLFSVKNGGKREYLQNQRVASLSNYDLEYSGQELQQDDLSVWMSLINMARNRPISDTLLFTGYQLVKDLGWRMHSESYARAKESIQRMKVTALLIKTSDEKGAYAGSLIRDYAWDELDEKGNVRWMVRFEPRVAHLFFNDMTSLVEWEIRKAIGTRHTTALWLHTFYTSHAEPFPYREEKLHELCRSGSPLAAFRKQLVLALGKLKDVGFLKSYMLKDGMVHVERATKLRLVATEASRRRLTAGGKK